MPMRLSSLIVFSKTSVISFNEYFNVDHYTTKINLMKLIFGQAPILLITCATRLWAYGYERLILTLFVMPMHLSSLIVFSKISVISFNEYFNVDNDTTKINLMKLIFGQVPILLITRATRLWAYGYERLILTLFAMPMRLSSLIVFSKISVISFNEYFNSFSPQPSRVDPEGSTGLKFNIFGSVQL